MRMLPLKSTWVGLPAIMLAGALCGGTPTRAADIRGEVQVQYIGTGAPAKDTVPAGISVAAFPLDHQAVPASPSKDHLIIVRKQRLWPTVITARRGDRLTFVNQNPVYHRVYSHLSPRQFSLALGKVGTREARASLMLDRVGVWNIFCDIANMYARVDVVDTPYYETLPGPGRFVFTDLAPGRWRLRVATVGGPAVERVTRAYTAPPPIVVGLRVWRGMVSRPAAADARDAEIEALFPGN